MKTPVTFRSKVSRRIVTLFVACALLPVTILAVVSFYQVSSQLRHDSEKQLTLTSKNVGMDIFGRLEVLDSDLQVLSLQLKDRRPLMAGQAAQKHFSSLAVFASDGKELAHSGSELKFPQLSAAEKDHLLSGKSLLRVETCGDGQGSCAALLRVSGGESVERVLLKGEANPQYLWTAPGLPLGLQMAVLTASREVLFCSEQSDCGPASAFPASSHASGFFAYGAAGESYDAAYWKLLVKPRFLQEPWTIVVGQAHGEALAPM